jgi:hypothetical protein
MIYFGPTTGSVSNSAQNYFAGGGACSGNTTNCVTVAPRAMTFSHCVARPGANITTGSYNVSVYRSGGACSISITLNSSSGKAAVFDDTNSCTAAKGEIVSATSTPTSTPTAVALSLSC